MKASLRFREEQKKKPLLRAKIPISILGMPFQSGIVAGDTKELTLNLSTFFQSGPSLKLSYRPNDSANPFSLIVKTGTGPFGSPISTSMLMSCEFNLLNRNPDNNKLGPLFMLHFKPRFGDFTFKKSQSSVFDPKRNGVVFAAGSGSDDDYDNSIEVIESPVKVPIFGDNSPAEAGAIVSLFAGTEVAARTTLPIKGRAAVNFRWGVRVPEEVKGESVYKKVPFLVMDKIGVEHLPESGNSKKAKGVVTGTGFPSSGDVAEACFAVKRQVEVLQAENGLLKNAVEDLRREIIGVPAFMGVQASGSEFAKYREFERKGGKGKNNEKKTTSDFSGYPGKSKENDASEELKKALKGATTVGV